MTAEDDFKERADPADRERVCARLVAVSSGSGEQTGAPSSAGAPVKFQRCPNKTSGHAVLCDACERDAGEVLIPTGWPDLVNEHRGYKRAPDGWAHKFVPSEAPRGRPVTGTTDREEIVDAIVERQREFRFESVAEWLLWRDRCTRRLRRRRASGSGTL